MINEHSMSETDFDWEFSAPHWIDFNAEDDPNVDKWFDLNLHNQQKTSVKDSTISQNPTTSINIRQSRLPRKKRNPNDPLNLPQSIDFSFGVTKIPENHSIDVNQLKAQKPSQIPKLKFASKSRLKPPSLRKIIKFDIN